MEGRISKKKKGSLTVFDVLFGILGLGLLALILFLGLPKSSSREGESLLIGGSTSMAPLLEHLVENYPTSDSSVYFEILPLGSERGISQLRAGDLQLGMSSRKLREEESVGLEIIEIARDTIALAVHKSNPTQGLSLGQLRALYKGEIRNWKELSSYEGPIHLLSREEISGTRKAFEELIGVSPIHKDIEVVVGSGGILKRIEEDPLAIGYLSLAMISDDVHPLRLEGQSPRSDLVVQGRYSLSRPFYLFYLPGSLNRETKRLIDWILSVEGQTLIAKSWVAIH